MMSLSFGYSQRNYQEDRDRTLDEKVILLWQLILLKKFCYYYKTGVFSSLFNNDIYVNK